MREPGRGRRVIAFLLSLIQPGAGHFLLGSFRRGIIWAVGVAAIGTGLLFAVPVGLLGLMLVLAVGIVGHVASAVDAVTRPVRRPRWALVLVGWAALIVGGLVMDPVKEKYKTHYLQAFTIPSGAMMDTLLVGDYILVDKSAYRARKPERGDVIVFMYPQDERRDFIKRIVGMPGDIVSVRGRQVVVNGTPLVEPYVRPVEAPLGRAGDTNVCGYAYGCEPTTVPPDSYFVMGDNRTNSQDSRHWGFVKKEKIRGKAIAIYWSWDTSRHALRWSRLGRSVA